MRRSCCFFVVLAFLVGCGSAEKFKPLTLYVVDGTLTVDGKPLSGINVTLFPSDEKSRAKPASGMTDKDGNFKLRTNGDRGVAEGTFKVVLGAGEQSEEKKSGALSPKELMELEMKKQAEYMKKGTTKKTYPFPPEWADVKTSPKTYEVTKSNQPLKISI